MLLSCKVILVLLMLQSLVNGKLVAAEIKLDAEPTTVDQARKILNEYEYEMPAARKTNGLKSLFQVAGFMKKQLKKDKQIIELAALMVRVENLKRLGYPEEIAFQKAENIASYKQAIASKVPVVAQSKEARLKEFELLDGFEDQKARILATTDDNEFEEEVRYWRMIQKGFAETQAHALSSSSLKTYAAGIFLAMLKGNQDNVNYAFDWAQKGINPYEVKTHFADNNLKSIRSAAEVSGDNPREIAQIIKLEAHRDAAKRWNSLQSFVVKPASRWTRTLQTLDQHLAAQNVKPVVPLGELAGTVRMHEPAPPRPIRFPEAQRSRPSSATSVR